MSELEAEERRRRILVLGGAHADTNYSAQGPVIPRHTVSAKKNQMFGGCAYNLGKVFSDLGLPVGIITVSGDDSLWRLIDLNLKKQRIEVDAAIYIPGFPTASYVAIHDEDGDMQLGAIVDDIYHQLTVDMLAKHIEKIRQAGTLVCDTSLPADIYAYLLTALPPEIDIFATISSLASANNIKPLLPRCKGLFGNVAEIKHLAGSFDATEEGTWDALEKLASYGTEGVFATDAKKVYALVNGKRFEFKAHEVEKVVSTHGAGDAFAATAIYCIKNGQSVERAIETALAAAALRVQDIELNRKALELALAANADEQKKRNKARLFSFKLHSH